MRTLKPGVAVKSGETIGIMGRTANTHEGISKDRAHVHFELNLLVSDRFAAWYKKNFPKQRNDHGQWNGQNLLGIDRVPFSRTKEQARNSTSFRLIQSQPELCRVMVRDTNFLWLTRYAPLVKTNPIATKRCGWIAMRLPLISLAFRLS